jgi:hypothetical protein
VKSYVGFITRLLGRVRRARVDRLKGAGGDSGRAGLLSRHRNGGVGLLGLDGEHRDGCFKDQPLATLSGIA